MQNRAEALSLLAELRGRLDELEQLICFAPDLSIKSPAIWDDPGVETLTPAPYLNFAAPPGPPPPQSLERYRPFCGFVQFGAPAANFSVLAEGFALSPLHRTATGPQLGLRLVPQPPPQMANPPWFTYEFPSGVIDLTEWDWLEWVLKLSFDARIGLQAHFVRNLPNDVERVYLPAPAGTEFATFMHFRLETSKLTQLPQHSGRVRLVLGLAGGQLIPLTLYGFGIYGKRHSAKDTDNAKGTDSGAEI